MHHANAATGQKIHCTLNVFHQLRNGKAVCNVIAHREKRLLVHLARFGVIPPQVFHLVIDFRQKRAVHHAGMTVVLHHENGLVRAGFIQFSARKQTSFFHGIRRSAKRNKRFRRALSREIGNHFLDFTVRARMHNIQARIERCKRCQMLVRVHKRRAQHTIAQLLARSISKAFRQVIAHINDTPLVFHQIARHAITRIHRQNCALINFHTCLLSCGFT